MNLNRQHDHKLNLRDRIVGLDQKVPLLNGQKVTYVNLDNAASTPALKDVMETIQRFMPYYSSVHRGTGFKSRVSTVAYDQAHEVIARFVGANPEQNTVVFGKNTTEAINKLSYRLPLSDDAVVICTQMEHHSNDLPWRHRAEVVHVKVTPDGRLDEEDFDRQLQQYAGRIALVTVTGASNVSGYIQPIHRLARKSHEVGARILVDAAQLAPHRRVDMKDDDHPEHLDFVALSAHKMYAPFGTGALIGPKEIFLYGPPEYPGGGTVDVVTLDEVYWAGMPDRDEAGSPNVVGAIAMAAAAQTLMEIGLDEIAAHEEALIVYALEKLSQLPGIRIYGQSDPARANEKVGAIPFNIEGISHFLVAAILGYEGGVGVRSGCFCAHPYVVHLLQLDEVTAGSWREQMLRGDKSNMPGMVRASFGCYSNEDDVDRLVEMLERVVRNQYEGDYQLIRSTGEYIPAGYQDPLAQYFLLDRSKNI
ncbi:MAG: aminotransferase class V-fold PLP-dependent enzyme [Chloroflexota bacterium]|jgi:selenocysteine lyase/cysteine desulfurase